MVLDLVVAKTPLLPAQTCKLTLVDLQTIIRREDIGFLSFALAHLLLLLLLVLQLLSELFLLSLVAAEAAGGGGGGGSWSGYSGGNGGSGIVIIRYLA